MSLKSVSNFKSMSIEKLSQFRDQVDAVLNAKVAQERRTVQDQLGRLDRLVASGSRAKDGRRGVRGAVPPKYCNPDNPVETWAGRGLTPRWLQAALKSGKKLEDFSIELAESRPRGRPRKARAK